MCDLTVFFLLIWFESSVCALILFDFLGHTLALSNLSTSLSLLSFLPCHAKYTPPPPLLLLQPGL